MFINLSNHPITSWDDEQCCAAEQWGTMVDVRFPTVFPEETGENISLLADNYFHQLMDMLPADEVNAVHVMGESTFVYSVVRRLREAGITCVASTTERIKTELPNGSFVSEFHFKQFRCYE